MADFQNEPIEEGSLDAADEEKIDGIVEQVRSDLRLGHAHDPEQSLRQRLFEAGMSVDEAEFERIRDTLESG
jgi:hypothetical protein